MSGNSGTSAKLSAPSTRPNDSILSRSLRSLQQPLVVETDRLYLLFTAFMLWQGLLTSCSSRYQFCVIDHTLNFSEKPSYIFKVFMIVLIIVLECLNFGLSRGYPKLFS